MPDITLSVAGPRREVMPCGGDEPMRIDAGGRMVMPENDLVRGTDLINYRTWSSPRNR